jgi:hypothetical protein
LWIGFCFGFNSGSREVSQKKLFRSPFILFFRHSTFTFHHAVQVLKLFRGEEYKQPNSEKTNQIKENVVLMLLENQFWTFFFTILFCFFVVVDFSSKQKLD